MNAKTRQLKPDAYRDVPTNLQEAIRSALEMLYQGKQKEFLDWSKVPRSDRALALCEREGVSLREIANPEILLPRAARYVLRLSRLLRDAASRIEQATSKHSERYYTALLVSSEISAENLRLATSVLAKSEVAGNLLAHSHSSFTAPSATSLSSVAEDHHHFDR
jgi:hypothetical protein